MLYADTTGLRFIHFAWHHDLRDQPASEDYFSSPCHAFDDDPFSTELLVAHAINVRTYKQLIAYGFGYESAMFDQKGRLVGLEDAGSGLTCATFVLAFFSSLGFEICIQSTWGARPDDREWQKNAMRHMAQTPTATCQHVMGMRKYVGSSRFRPDEVAVSAASSNIALDFSTARTLADELQQLLSGH